jgi:transposase
LRSLKRGVRDRAGVAPVRVIGIDDWSWQKGRTYGTIMVDLERREVLDILQDRSAESTARWLGGHPAVEMVSRDRCGLYAQGAARGAPQAGQVADRFHLLQNLRIWRDLAATSASTVISPSAGSPGNWPSPR